MRFIYKNEFKIFLTFFIVYSFFIQWSTWNEESRFALTRAIVDEQRLEIDSYANQTGDRAYYNGHYYTDKEPGTSLIATPIYYIVKSIWQPGYTKDYLIYYQPTFKGGKVSIVFPLNDSSTQLSMIMVTVFCSSLFSALTVVLIYKISKYFCKREKFRMLVVIIAGFGTLLFSTALLFWSHAFATFLSFLSFYLLFTRRNRSSFLLSGIFLGYSISSSIYSILFLVSYLFYLLLLKEKRFLFFLSGMCFGLLLIIFYKYYIYDVISIVGRGPSDPEIWDGKPEYSDALRIPFLHLTISIHEIAIFPHILIKLLFYPERGLFFYSPILILSLFGLKNLYKKHKPEFFLVAFIFLFFLSSLSVRTDFWFSGITFGQRDFVFVVPFLMIPLIYSIQRINLKIVYALLFLSIFFNILGLQALESLSLHSSPIDFNSSHFVPDVKKFNFFYNGDINVTKMHEQVLRNPLFEYYLPLFLRNGPRSRIFESVLNSIIEKRISIDIRYMSHLPTSPDRYLKYDKLSMFSLPRLGTFVLRIPFLCLVPLSLIIFGIWHRDILNNEKIKKHLNKKRIITIFFVLLLLFFLFFVHIE
jgi:hypothetical protein